MALKLRKSKKPVQAHEAEVLDSVEQANKDRNEALRGDVAAEVYVDPSFVAEPHRKKGETVAEYNERVPVALQPVQPGPTHSYLGNKL